MTICRSSLITLAGAAFLAGVPAKVAAQATPATHTVRRGDTLWDIARQYLGDPVLWPQIYRLNTQVVEDPHWIYPGEVLQLVAGANQAPAVPAQDTPPPAAANPPGDNPEPPQVAMQEPPPRRGEAPVDGTPFWVRRPAQQDAGIAAFQARTVRPLRRGEYFSSGFLTEGEQLPFGTLKGTVTPPQIRSLSSQGGTTLFTTVGLVPPAGGSYAVGDTLLVALTAPTHGDYGDIVIPTGLIRVTGQSDGEYLAEVISVYGPVRQGQRVLPAGRFTPGPDLPPVAVENGMTGRVLASRVQRELKLPNNVLFLDIGQGAGVATGDVFELRREVQERPDAASTVDELMAVGQVVRVRDRTATLLLTRIVSPDIPPGTLARLVAKLPG